MRVIGSALFLAAVATLITPASSAQSTGMALEEVIVSAQKREESLQDVPISVATLGQEQLKIRAIDTLADIGADIPNVTVNSFNTSPSTVRLFVRGIGQNDSQITQDPSVALYLDGVYIGTSFGAGFDGVDMERIEVLRGPQGTLYGRNATGGAVNIITRRANTEALEFKQDLTVGNDGMFKAKTVFNTPVVDEVAVKFSYFHNELDGIVENKGPGEDFGMKDNDSLVLDARIEPADTFTVDLRYEYARLKNSQNYEQITMPNTTGVIAGLVQHNVIDNDRRDKVTALRPVRDSDLDIDAASMHLDWAVSDALSIRSISAWRDLDNEFYHETFPTSIMVNNGGAPILSGNQVEYEQYSQEFQLLGDMERLSYTAGIYYFYDESSQDANGSILLGGLQPRNFADAENKSLAIYGEATYTPEFMDSRWHFTLGGRYSKDDREASRDNQVDNVFGKYDKDFENFNPSGTVVFDVTDDINVYGKITTGYKSGGTSQRSANQALFSRGFDEEEITNYELGFKGDLLDRRVRLNAAAFYMDLDGYQSSIQTGSTPGQRDFLPLDDNEIKGVELDMMALLTQELTLSLGYGYLDTKLGEKSVIVPPGIEYFLTDELAYSPEHSYTAALDYRRTLNNGEVGANINYAYQDNAITSINRVDTTELDDYGLLGAALSWNNIEISGLPGTVSLLLWGKNLTDMEYGTLSTAAFEPFGVDELLTFGSPRSYGLTVTYDYF